jgi:hypothetical protein
VEIPSDAEVRRVIALRPLVARVATSLPFRVALAVLCLYFHVTMMTRVGRDRFEYKFDADPLHPPSFQHPATDMRPTNWDRLVVARWDAQHYEAIALRGYSTCKDKSQLESGEYPDDDRTCELDFYPTYGWIGAVVMKVTHQPVDFSLYGISLLASFLFLVMWTSRTMVDGLGLGLTYLSLLLLNLFDTAYTLVTVQTEPCVLVLTLGAFICLRKRWLLAGAIAAGAATSIRISGVATGFAYCAGLLVLTLTEPPRQRGQWAWRVLLMAVSGWGILALMAYYWRRFGDPLIYAHAHERAFHHHASLAKIFIPDGRLLMQSIWAEPNEGVILAAGLLWFALGHRKGLVGFPVEARAFFYVLFFGIVGICMYGSVEYAYGGNSRYMVTVLPLFFAMAGVMRRRPVVLALWLFMSVMHAYHGNICFYIGQNHPERLHRCSFARYFRSEGLSDGTEQ